MKKIRTSFLLLLLGLNGFSTAFAASALVNEDASADRLISSPTAISTQGGFSVDADLSSFVGYAFALGGTARYTKEISNQISVGLGSNVGILLAPEISSVPIFYGAGPMISFGNKEYSTTFGALMYGAHAKNLNDWLLLPSAGFSAKLSEILRFNAELVIPVTSHDFSSINTGLFMYGFRFGNKIYGGVDLLLPFGGDSTAIYHYFPIGIPIFSVGMGF
jgi:hypothetical protein